MKKEPSVEIRRKIVHLALGILIVFGLHFNYVDGGLLFALALVTAAFFLFAKRTRIPIVERLLDMFEREDTRKKLPGRGMIFYLFGTSICALLFSTDIAIISVIVLAIGDSAPDMIRMIIKGSKSNIVGNFSGFLLCVFLSMQFVAWHEALIASAAGMVAESIDFVIGLEKIDDNLIIPIVSGTIVFLMRLF